MKITARARVIIDNDFSGDPDGLVQLAHHLLSPSVEIPLIIGSHLAPGDPFDPSSRTANNAVAAAERVIDLLGLTGHTVVAGSNEAMIDPVTPRRSAATDALIAEALRTDTTLPLYVACGAGLTEIASACLLEPSIVGRFTVVWIGGPEYDLPGVHTPPGSTGSEYNLAIDIPAARMLFASRVLLWQVPRPAYRQTLFSWAELDTQVLPAGPVGRHLVDALSAVATMAGRHGVNLGETYILGDSPLVLLTALQSAFEADPSSSEYVWVAAPGIRSDGSYDPIPVTDAREIRVYTRLDTRLLFGDLVAKLTLHAATAGENS